MRKSQVIQLLKDLLHAELTEDTYLLTLKETEAIKNERGLVLRFADGQELQVTVDQANISVRRVITRSTGPIV